MNMEERNGNIILQNADEFDLIQTFECGQCFRWDAGADGVYTGVHKGYVLRIGQQGNSVTFYHTTRAEFESVWAPYFDLKNDYKAIQATLSRDPVLAQAIQAGKGIRILAQEPFETLISFIISANNNIPRIKGIIERLCTEFGEAIPNQDGIYYAFPTAEALAVLSRSELAPIRAGFRDNYILDAAQKVAGGALDLTALYGMDYDSAKNELKKVKGVGDKVADCVLLFGYGKYNAFPVDVWVRRVLAHYYPGGAHQSDPAAFARARFGTLGGFAQQYLFYHARESKIAK